MRWGRKGRIKSDINTETNINYFLFKCEILNLQVFPVQSVHQSYPSLLLLWLSLSSGRACGYLGASGGITIVYLSIFSLHSDSPLLGTVAFLPSFPLIDFLNVIFLFSLFSLWSYHLDFQWSPKKQVTIRHGISEVAIKYTKLVILCRKKYNLGFFLIMYGFLLWVGFCFVLVFILYGLIFFEL